MLTERQLQTPRHCLWLSLAVLLAVGATVAAADQPTSRPEWIKPVDYESFPQFPEIQEHVEFWKQVYATWSRNEFAVHDLAYPAIIYEVVTLPGEVDGALTSSQRRFMKDADKRWEARVQTAVRKAAKGETLTEAEAGWIRSIESYGGSEALGDAHRRVRTQRGLRQRFLRGIEIAERYDKRLRAIFRDAGLPEDLVFLPHVESSFQTRARSSAGAVGVWQFTRGTGRRFMTVNSAVDQRLDPIIAGEAAARYLTLAFEKLGDWPIALTSYNHGILGMRRATDKLGTDYVRIFHEWNGRHFGFASKNFYAEFLAAREIAANPDHYFGTDWTPEPEFDLEPYSLTKRSSVQRLSSAFGIPVDELAQINPAWTRRAVRDGYGLPTGLPIWLPPNTLQQVETAETELDYALPERSEQFGEYIVRSGDSLSEIAEAFGLGLSELRELNEIPRNRSTIRVGQKLRVRHTIDTATTSRTHVVRRGESLSTIAKRYRTSVASIRRLNGIPSRSSLIRIGQRLQVAGGEAPQVHVVRRGDSLMRIAVRYGIRFSELLRVNQLHERSIIHPGQSLQIP